MHLQKFSSPKPYFVPYVAVTFFKSVLSPCIICCILILGLRVDKCHKIDTLFVTVCLFGWFWAWEVVYGYAAFRAWDRVK